MWSIQARPREVGRLLLSAQVRLASTRGTVGKAQLVAEGDLAKRLLDTNVWRPHNSKTARPKIPGEKSRVNITSEKLCDDIESYLGPSLKRHEGCDLVDLFPGAGLWSTKLHEMVKPRRHILMDPDARLYAPFLENLTSKPGTTLIPKSGLVWPDLHKALDSLSDQKPLDPQSDEPPKRNDTLLVTANLSQYPRNRMTPLFLYQLISAVRTRHIFQRYGLVRMLIWARPEDVHPSILPVSVQQRGRAALEAELACEWINQVASPDFQDPAVQAGIFRFKRAGGPRDHAIELYSAYRTLQRLKEQGLEIPEGRETGFIKEAMNIKDADKAFAESMLSPTAAPAYSAELEELEREFREGLFDKKSDKHKRLKALGYRHNNAVKEAETFGALLREYDELQRMYAEGASKEKILAAEGTWNDKIENLPSHPQSNFRLVKDNLHLVRQEPGPLLWDRRTLEPLVVDRGEFFPNIPSCLLDVQPKAPDPVLARHSEGSRVFELLAKVMLRGTRTPVSESLDGVFTDTSEGILHECPSLRDPARGGSVVKGNGEVNVRTMTEEQWGEIVRAWLRWPFRPSIEALERQHEEIDEDEEGSGAQAHSEFTL